jgi:hypothetical protein
MKQRREFDVPQLFEHLLAAFRLRKASAHAETMYCSLSGFKSGMAGLQDFSRTIGSGCEFPPFRYCLDLRKWRHMK